MNEERVITLENIVLKDLVRLPGIELVQFGKAANFAQTEQGVQQRTEVQLGGDANSGALHVGGIELRLRKDSDANALKVGLLDQNLGGVHVRMLCTDKNNIFWSHNLEATPDDDHTVKHIGRVRNRQRIIVMAEQELNAAGETGLPLLVLRVSDKATNQQKQYFVRSVLKDNVVQCDVEEGQLKTEYDELVDRVAEAETQGNESLYMERLGHLLRAIQKSLDGIAWGEDVGNTFNRLPRLESVQQQTQANLLKPWKVNEEYRVESVVADTIDRNGQPSGGIASKNTGEIVTTRCNSFTRGRYLKFTTQRNRGGVPNLKSDYGIWIKLHKMGSKLPKEG